MIKPDVIAIGTTFVDYFFEADEKFLQQHNLKPEDDFLFEETELTSKKLQSLLPILSRSPGGISTNTITILAKLGISCTYNGVVGLDEDSRFWKKNLLNVKTKTLAKGKISFCACILTNKRKNRLFLSQINKFDNDYFKFSDTSFLNTARLIHMSPFLNEPEKSLKKVEKLVEKITKPEIGFSPGMIHCNLGISKLKPLLEQSDIIFLNKDELKALVNKPPKPGSKQLLKIGPKIIVCTLGEKGVLVSTKETQLFVPSRKVKKIVDSTGAGDAFAAGFLFGYLKNKPLPWCAKFGNKIAFLALANYGLNWLRRTNKLYNVSK